MGSAAAGTTTDVPERLAWAARLRARLPPDPGRAGLRRAARAALVMPATFAFAHFVIRNAQIETFAAFGCFALLVMGDFGGLRRPRALAYAAVIGVGGVLIALGTLASFNVWVAAFGMLLVGFVVSFAGVFGSYAAASQTALLLAFVLAVSISAPPAAVAPRLAGWLVAGVVSTLAAIFLWPRFERVALRQRAASACRAIGPLIQAQRSRADSAEIARAQQAAEAALADVVQAYATTPKRPAGPALRERAFVELLSELERTLAFVTRPSRIQLSAHHPCLQEGDRLAAVVVETLAESADVLTGGAPPNLLKLQAARNAHREALDRWAAEALRSGRSPEEVLDGLAADDALRVVAYLALALGSNAAIAMGTHVDTAVPVPAGTPTQEGAAGVLLRAGQTIRTYLAPTSSVLHNSLRVAIGLALAVLISQLFQLSHAFWVVLGTLSALRSNALATGRTTLQAIAGTLIGFAIGAVLLVLVGSATTPLWFALPITVFFAAYAASAIGFVAGQAAFTVVVLILFNVIAPVGWQLGVARLEDVVVGVSISIVVGLLLWPRGARSELRATLAGLYRAIAGLLADTFERLLGAEATEAAGRARAQAVAASSRAGEALEQYARERGVQPLPPEIAGSLLAAGADAILAADLLDMIAPKGDQAYAESAEVTAMRGQARIVVDAYARLADRLDGFSAIAPESCISEDAVRAAELSGLRRWRDDPDARRAALAVVKAGEWIQYLDTLAATLQESAAKVAAAAHVLWWR